jgi:hypothetical protein
MTERRLGTLAWTVCAVTLAMLLAIVVMAIFDPGSRGPAESGPAAPSTANVVDGLFWKVNVAIPFMAIACVGGIVSARRPGNAVGWLLSAVAFGWTLAFLADSLYWHFAFGNPGYSDAVDVFAWLGSWSVGASLSILLTLVPLLFPTGAPPSARWRGLVWVAATAAVLGVVGTALQPGPMESVDAGFIDNPLGVGGAVATALARVGGGAAFALAPLAVVSLVVRYRRSYGVERLQLKWFTFAVCLCFIVALGTVVEGALFGGYLGWPVLLAGMLIVAASIAIALLRYRLYDIDVVINRALVYGALTTTLAAAYIASVLVLQLVVSPGSDLAVAGSTLAVAALFRPARARIQAAVDRRFYRRRYDAQRTLESFAAQLRDEVELDALTADLRGVVAHTVQPAHVSLWLRSRNASRTAGP